MKCFIKFILCLFFIFCICLLSSQSIAQISSPEYELEILKKTQKKVEIAITNFLKIEDSAVDDSLAKKARSTLLEDLKFSELFREVSPTRFARIEQTNQDASSINYKIWRDKVINGF